MVSSISVSRVCLFLPLPPPPPPSVPLNPNRRFRVVLDTFQLNESDKGFLSLEYHSDGQRGVEYCQTIIKSSVARDESDIGRNIGWPIYIYIYIILYMDRMEKCNYQRLCETLATWNFRKLVLQFKWIRCRTRDTTSFVIVTDFFSC